MINTDGEHNQREPVFLVEGPVISAVENASAKIPSVFYMGLALLSIGLSVTLAAKSERKWIANFVGHWAPTLMLFGIFNKLIKIERDVGSLKDSNS